MFYQFQNIGPQFFQHPILLLKFLIFTHLVNSSSYKLQLTWKDEARSSNTAGADKTIPVMSCGLSTTVRVVINPPWIHHVTSYGATYEHIPLTLLWRKVASQNVWILSLLNVVSYLGHKFDNCLYELCHPHFYHVQLQRKSNTPVLFNCKYSIPWSWA